MNWNDIDVKYTPLQWVIFISLSVLAGNGSYVFLNVSFTQSLIVAGITATIIHFIFYFRDKNKK